MENNNGSDSGSAMGWVVLLIVVLLAGWFLYTYGVPKMKNSDINIDVNLPTNDSGSGDTSQNQ